MSFILFSDKVPEVGHIEEVITGKTTSVNTDGPETSASLADSNVAKSIQGNICKKSAATTSDGQETSTPAAGATTNEQKEEIKNKESQDKDKPKSNESDEDCDPELLR